MNRELTPAEKALFASRTFAVGDVVEIAVAYLPRIGCAVEEKMLPGVICAVNGGQVTVKHPGVKGLMRDYPLDSIHLRDMSVPPDDPSRSLAWLDLNPDYTDNPWLLPSHRRPTWDGKEWIWP